mmetsp:Transcript_88925/g.167579  ORF Transcript_88925/g.167579 Transcript_88925/m.167579 type:complete len:405 (-) Transcript_88925:530-1744(-)
MTVISLAGNSDPDKASIHVDVPGDLPPPLNVDFETGGLQRLVSIQSTASIHRCISSESFHCVISGDRNFGEPDSQMNWGQSTASSRSAYSFVPGILAPMSPTRKDDLFIFDVGDLEVKYHLKQQIGKGGYGMVRKGIAKDSKKHVAIKSIELESLKVTNAYDKEMIVAWMMVHPYLVGLIECFSDDKTLHLVMDYLSGSTIHGLIQTRKRYGQPGGLPTGQQERFVWAMLSGISYLHHHKIAHRDCKTENFMQERDCEAAPLKLIDFGLAVRVQKEQPLTEKVGTPEFAAPEVARGSYNEKCDIWSIGVVAYIVCVGFQPFDGKTAVEVMKKARDKEAKFDSHRWDLVRPHLKELVQDMLVKDPSNRSSAKKLADQNEDWFAKVKDSEEQAAVQGEQPKCCIVS